MDPLRYDATNTGAAFHRDNARERWVIGPVGGGKTVMGSMELFMRMCAQEPHPFTRKRSTRWIVIRQSYPQLVSTTIKTWMEWAGRFGTLRGQSPITWTCSMKLPDNTILDAEVLFYAMSEGFDTSKLRSLEVTGGFISEFAEIEQEVIDVLSTRFRYPKTYTQAVDGYDYGPTWTGMFGESNAPSMNSHWYQRFEVDRPEGCHVFKQPGALIRTFDTATGAYTYEDNPQAENIIRLPGKYNYYHSMIKSMSDEAIDNLVLNNYGKDMTGRPVFPSFSRERHVVPSDRLLPNPNYPLLIGIDPGLNAAAALTQMTPMGGLSVLDEVFTEGLTFEQFIDEHLIPVLRQTKYAKCKVECVIDPAALSRNPMSNLTPIAMLRAKGIAARPAVTNKVEPRLKAVESFLQRDGRLFISAGCTTLVEAMDGGYRYARVRGATSKVYKTEPDKNRYSHLADALQYCALEYVSQASLNDYGKAAAPHHRTRYA